MPQKSRGCQGVALDVPEYGKSPNSLYINVYVYTKEHYCTSMDAPVQFDDPAHEIRIGLLPERFATLAEELVDEGGDTVGERVGVEQRIVERVPLQRAVEPDLQVVVRRARRLRGSSARLWQKQGSVFASPDGTTTWLHPTGCVYHLVRPKVVNRITRWVYDRNGEI